MFKWLQRGFTLLSCLLLLFLFIMPGQYLKTCNVQIGSLCDQAIETLMMDDIETASAVCGTLAQEFQNCCVHLKRYLDNAAVDDVEHGIDLASNQVAANDSAGALVTFIGIKHSMSYLRSLESFEWNSIL